MKTRALHYIVCFFSVFSSVRSSVAFRMDGFEATRRLRTMGYNDLPIYGLTASVSRSDFTELGFDDWLPKPIMMKDLKAKLYRLRQCISLAAISETQAVPYV